MMTNKERYKQAFSALHPSGQLSLEVEEMALIQKDGDGCYPFMQSGEPKDDESLYTFLPAD